MYLFPADLPTRALLSLASATFIVGASLASASWAADTPDPSDELVPTPTQPDPARYGPIRTKLHDWEVTVGGGAMYKPSFEGSDKMELSPIPFVSARLFDRLAIDPTGLELDAYKHGPFTLGLLVGYDSGRDEDDGDDDYLRGLGNVDFGVNLGVKAALEYGPAEFYGTINKTIGGSDGLLGKMGVEVKQPLSENFILGLDASVTVADENYMDSYFSVNNNQAANSRFGEYKADAGFQRADFALTATYLATENWIVRGKAGLGLLLGDAADSPIVQKKTQPEFGLFVAYRF
ncbi:MipA/OmpV family protein [Phyllobacterium endophyticum]|uniref:MipA/OmpV family protein n=1 Tax=Phyllobacterium endophyticum TaxID=1149773 RepID=A0A2P7ASA0_9HYPH|nr:MipA/OmpV family protein [Phyllobacterium endophyticum]MBB3236779.1 outer membrane scaffolding protein for murein synthesis (MipA/OmpV family) [Phyllobacterium endophyticum]PSH57053.1 MipA/OmpV family protein [Phyllobacterium endophyticum]TYR40333.1 MipA/OmpV family protein [Phyllobacterium endophyticum]